MKKKVVRKRVVKSGKKAVKKTVKKSVKKLAKKPIKKKPLKKPFKKPIKKPAKKNIGKKKAAVALEGKLVGEVTHYFPQVNAAVVKLKIPLAVGDNIKVKGHTTDFTQKISSLQIDRVSVLAAKVGDEIGLQVKSRVRRGDIVTKL